ncbi:MAG: hypothetical protein ABSH15_04405 [Verrucomicrobiota bacterium]|jgi:hypothetical protein
MNLQPSTFNLQSRREAGYLLVDDASGVAELEKRTAPKVRIVEGIIVGAIFGVGFTCLLIAFITWLRFHYLP